MTARDRSTRIAIAVGAALGPLLAASPAAAHLDGSASALGDGLRHPLGGADHLLAMVAVGIVAIVGRQRMAAWIAPSSFLAGMIAGGAAGLLGLALPGGEALIAISVVLLGLALAGVAFARPWAIAVLVGAGAAHGHAHGAEWSSLGSPLAYLGGFLAATVLLHAFGAAIGVVAADRRTLRLAMGAATASSGLLLLA